MLTVTFRKTGRPTVSRRVPDSDFSCTRAANGGWRTAEINVPLTATERDRIAGSYVVVEGLATHFMGFVLRPPAQGEGRVYCVGHSYGMKREPFEAYWCHTNVADWKQRTRRTINTDVSVTNEPSTITVRWHNGYNYTTNDYNGVYLLIPPTDSVRLEFTWTRTNSNYSVTCTYGAMQAASSGEDFATTVVSSSSPTSFAQTFSGTDLAALTLNGTIDTSVTPLGTDQSVTFSNIKVYGYDGVTSATVSNVADAILDTLDTDILPSGSEYRAWMDSVTAVVEPLYFGYGGKTADAQMEELLRYTAHDFGWQAKTVNNKTVAVPVLEAWPTDPEYILRLSDDGVDATLTYSDLSELANAVRVNYTDPDTGRSTYVDRTTTDAGVTDNYLDTLGITQKHTIHAETASSDTAEDMGDAYLSDPRRRSLVAAGRVDVSVPVKSTNGTVEPWAIKPGRLVRFDLDGAPVTSRITEVEQHGESSVTLDLDHGRSRIDVLLARLMKRE